ncbi:Actin-binding protein IPP [Eumeta japonica]|uniref:Actin-binding protein IPP n=1 Tax=Eumeta variegata TaxID=151549 RepID=A0A4C1ZMX9_EUMVA|nr:Actin-binding protein IPP [Eumeta japonica]
MSNGSEIVIRANEACLFKSEKYSLSSENVTNNFKIFRQDGTLCDVDLVSGDTVVKAHRVVLAAGCVYFETMFKSGLEECNKKSVSLPSIAPDVLPLMVEFIYTGQTVINGSTVTHLVDAANMLQLQELSVGCAQYLGKHLHPSNVLGILRFAETYNLVKLAEEAFSYAEIQWCAVVNEEEFMDLSLTTLMKLLMSNKLVIESEVQVLHAILRWLHYKLQSRREHCLKLLELIRLREVPIEKLEYAITSVQDPVIKQYLEGFKSAMSAVAREPRRDAPNCLYVVGGNNRSTRRLRTAVMFNGKAWTQISPMSAPRLGPGVAALGGRMYAVGGQNYNFQVLASGEVYDPRVSARARYLKISSRFRM